jgi:hypothetical protein
MSEAAALKVAVELLHVPSRVRLVRAEPLPRGVHLLLRIAAGEAAAAEEAAATADRSVDVVRSAAAFFIEQILLSPEGDSYRVLGAGPEASPAELRRNMALLMKWLHPDSDRQGQQSVFVNRVTLAWDDLKTPERRRAYEQERRALEARSPVRRHNGRSRARAQKSSLRPDRGHRQGLIRRALMFLLGGARR